MIYKFIICFIAGMSAAAVISPMLTCHDGCGSYLYSVWKFYCEPYS